MSGHLSQRGRGFTQYHYNPKYNNMPPPNAPMGPRGGQSVGGFANRGQSGGFSNQGLVGGVASRCQSSVGFSNQGLVGGVGNRACEQTSPVPFDSSRVVGAEGHRLTYAPRTYYPMPGYVDQADLPAGVGMTKNDTKCLNFRALLIPGHLQNGACLHNCVSCGLSHQGELCHRLWCSKSFHRTHGLRKTVPEYVRLRPTAQDCRVLVDMGHQHFAKLRPLTNKASRGPGGQDRPAMPTLHAMPTLPALPTVPTMPTVLAPPARPAPDAVPEEHAAKRPRGMEDQLRESERLRQEEVRLRQEETRMRQEEVRMRRRAEEEAAEMRRQMQELQEQLKFASAALNRKRTVEDVKRNRGGTIKEVPRDQESTEMPTLKKESLEEGEIDDGPVIKQEYE